MTRKGTYEVDQIREMHLGVEIYVYNLGRIYDAHLDRFAGGGLMVMRKGLDIENLGWCWGSEGRSQLLLCALLLLL